VKMIKVLIVDDSAIMRSILSEILGSDPGIEIIGTAPDVQVARRKIKALNPDVITLDVELPGMDGISFLQKIMQLRPTPVVMISGHTQENSEVALKALEMGAIDVIGKSAINVDLSISGKSDEIREKVKSAANANVAGIRSGQLSADKKPTGQISSSNLTSDKLIFVGASAGGVEAMRQVIGRLPPDCPPLLYTQHMPKEFTGPFAKRLNDGSALQVHEAEDQMQINQGHIYLAPGNAHLSISQRKGSFYCRLDRGDPVNGHRPSVDVLFRSAAQLLGKKAIGVILTGMGKDGAAGLLEMSQAGSFTLGQDKATSLIYGMPRVAMEMGAVSMQASLRRIPEEIMNACRKIDGRSSAKGSEFAEPSKK